MPDQSDCTVDVGRWTVIWWTVNDERLTVHAARWTALLHTSLPTPHSSPLYTSSRRNDLSTSTVGTCVNVFCVFEFENDANET
jgi:hypothetical protein